MQILIFVDNDNYERARPVGDKLRKHGLKVAYRNPQFFRESEFEPADSVIIQSGYEIVGNSYVGRGIEARVLESLLEELEHTDEIQDGQDQGQKPEGAESSVQKDEQEQDGEAEESQVSEEVNLDPAPEAEELSEPRASEAQPEPQSPPESTLEPKPRRRGTR